MFVGKAIRSQLKIIRMHILIRGFSFNNDIDICKILLKTAEKLRNLCIEENNKSTLLTKYMLTRVSAISEQSLQNFSTILSRSIRQCIYVFTKQQDIDMFNTVRCQEITLDPYIIIQTKILLSITFKQSVMVNFEVVTLQ